MPVGEFADLISWGLVNNARLQLDNLAEILGAVVLALST